MINKISLSSAKQDFCKKSATQIDESLRQSLFEEFPDVFPEEDTVLPLTPMKGPSMKIDLVESAIPYKRHNANAIPFHWKKKVKDQLDSMIKKLESIKYLL